MFKKLCSHSCRLRLPMFDLLQSNFTQGDALPAKPAGTWSWHQAEQHWSCDLNAKTKSTTSRWQIVFLLIFFFFWTSMHNARLHWDSAPALTLLNQFNFQQGKQQVRLSLQWKMSLMVGTPQGKQCSDSLSVEKHLCTVQPAIPARPCSHSTMQWRMSAVLVYSVWWPPG